MKISRQWKVENGNLSDVVINFIKNSKGKFRLTFEEWKEARSSQQNRYYWAYLTIISWELGDNPNDLHEYFKRKHLPPKFISVMGKEVKIPASTTKLTKEEFGKYIDAIELECGVPSPNPDEIYL
ncbi:MAG: hypothetical protein WCH62_05180 [Candidatus Omnitrophota bacterium]